VVEVRHPWAGVSLDTLFASVPTTASHTMVHSNGGYTTNVPLADLLGGKTWLVHRFDGEPLTPEHGGPARLLVLHLYFWKSAKWLSGIHHDDRGAARLLREPGLPHLRRPWPQQRYMGD
jgi:DMSO/TMAO reductase YedYZ molybdopterin-dependent catalytic subunit